jgi:hypothetical protein
VVIKKFNSKKFHAASKSYSNPNYAIKYRNQTNVTL